jgi:hypothetical protein
MTLSDGNDDVDLSALTTEQLIEIASHMSDAEDIQFSTTITPFIELEVSTDNNPLERVSATLTIAEVDGLHAFIPVTAEYGGLVEAETGKAIAKSEIPLGVPLTGAFKEVVLSIHDIVKLFRLGPQTQWKVIGHGSFTD